MPRRVATHKSRAPSRLMPLAKGDLMSRRVALAFVAIVVLAGAGLAFWVVSQRGGPIEGAADSPDAFVASFPEDWDCLTDINPDGATAFAQCPGIGRYYYYFIAEEALDRLPHGDEEGKTESCTLLSGTTVASNVLGLNPENPSPEFEFGDVEALVDSFAGEVETFGTACPD